MYYYILIVLILVLTFIWYTKENYGKPPGTKPDPILPSNGWPAAPKEYWATSASSMSVGSTLSYDFRTQDRL